MGIHSLINTKRGTQLMRPITARPITKAAKKKHRPSIRFDASRKQCHSVKHCCRIHTFRSVLRLNCVKTETELRKTPVYDIPFARRNKFKNSFLLYALRYITSLSVTCNSFIICVRNVLSLHSIVYLGMSFLCVFFISTDCLYIQLQISCDSKTQ